MAGGFDDLVAAQRETNDALAFEARLARTDRLDERKRRAYWRAALFGTVALVVVWLASGIALARVRYPHLYRTYQRMRAAPVAAGLVVGKEHDFGFYQVCTAANYTPVQTLMSAVLVWKSLSFKGAVFLQQSLEWFGKKAAADPRAALTRAHWSGVPELYSKLVGNDGWASGGCATSTLQLRQQTLVANWSRSAGEGNPWFHLLPDPSASAQSRQDFLDVPMIRDLYTDAATTGAAASACDTSAFWTSKIAILMTSGLCGVAWAETNATQSAADLWRELFASEVTVKPDCAGASQAGAVQGAFSIGTSAAMLGMVPGLGGIAAVGIAAAGAIAGGIAGGVSAAASAKDACEQQAAV